MNETSISKKLQKYAYPLIALISFLLYAQTLRYHFVWDDYALIVIQDHFQKWENFVRFFQYPFWHIAVGGDSTYHRPLIPVYILLASKVFKTNPHGYHFLSISLYAVGNCLLFRLLKKIFPEKTAWVAVLLFAVHPIHTEVVSWICCFSVMLASLFFLEAFRISISLNAQENWRLTSLKLAGVMLLYFAGLNTYPLVIVLPVLAFGTFFLAQKNNQPKTLGLTALESILFGGVTIAYFLYALYAVRKTGPDLGLSAFYDPFAANILYTAQAHEWFLTPLNTLSRYLELLMFPLNQSAESFFRSTELSFSAMTCLVGFMLLSLMMLRSSRKKEVLYSLLWILAGLAPALNLRPQGGLFCDRYAYLSSMGFCVWLALLYDHFNDSVERKKTHLKNLPRILFLSIGLLFALKSWHYSKVWRNDLNFWIETSFLSPEKARPHERLGILFAAENQFEIAEKEFRKAIELNPGNSWIIYKRLADLLKKQSRDKEAEKYEQLFQENVSKLNQEAKQTSELLIDYSNLPPA